MSPISPSISARGVRAATESMTTTSSAPERIEHVGDLERLLARVGLGDEQLVDVDADGLGVDRVHRVLGVDVGADAAVALGLGHHVHGEGGLARRLRAEDLDDPAPGQAADAEGEVEGQGARWGWPRSPSWPFSPILMMEPLPNCFSIWPRAMSSALSRSTGVSLWSRTSSRLACPDLVSPGPAPAEPVRWRTAGPERGARRCGSTLRRGCDSGRWSGLCRCANDRTVTSNRCSRQGLVHVRTARPMARIARGAGATARR